MHFHKSKSRWYAILWLVVFFFMIDRIMLQIIIFSILEQKKKKKYTSKYGQRINNVIGPKSKEGLLLSDNTGQDFMKEEAFI